MGRVPFLTAALLLIPLSLAAQEKPPEPHPFWDRTNIVLHVANATAQTIDGYATQHALRRNRRELNPVARPFARQGWSGQAVYSFGLGVGGTLAASYLLHRMGYHKQERLAPLIIATPTAISAGFNFRF
jgi:hypothetical protein